MALSHVIVMTRLCSMHLHAPGLSGCIIFPLSCEPVVELAARGKSTLRSAPIGSLRDSFITPPRGLDIGD
jgi:hypothetical protein